jgi:hypothetical protein
LKIFWGVFDSADAVLNIIFDKTPTPIALAVMVAMRGAGRDKERRRAMAE